MEITLYRPTGYKELDLISKSGWKKWPPRLVDQPIFYPVMTFEYAEKIARDWNSVLPSPDNLGFVTQFKIPEVLLETYPVKLAGGKEHRELWVPSEELENFNEYIIGQIHVIAMYRDKIRLF